MGPTINGRTALQCFKLGNAVEIRNGIMFDFYPGLPHMYFTVKSYDEELHLWKHFPSWRVSQVLSMHV